VLEFRQVTAAHEQSPVRYEAVIRNEGTEPAGWGQLYLDVPNDFAWALQYDPMLCFHYESEDLDCEVFALPPGEQVVYAFDYVVQAPPGDYQVTATYQPVPGPGAAGADDVVGDHLGGTLRGAAGGLVATSQRR